MIKNLQDLVLQIKEQIPIHELVSEYIPLKKSGRSYVALCPFHNDHKPSLHVNSEKGIFKCFSCGTGGDIIHFYSQINKKKFYESVLDLAMKYGFRIEHGEENLPEVKLKNNLLELNRDALNFFKRNLFLEDTKDALNYLTNIRKYGQEVIAKYELGFALNSWNALLKYLTHEKHYSNDCIASSGLFVQKENSDDYYDRFRNRIIIPIYNESSSIIGFGGRTISNEEPKYLNSPETLIFNKGSCLYGLNFAKEEIKKLDFVILTEGYFDVITAHQKGLLNTVATLGTALTGKQARILAKYTESKKLCLCLDSDRAGKKAAEGVFKVINDKQNPVFLDVSVVSNLGGKDLDETLNSNSTEFVINKIKSAQQLINFVLDEITCLYGDDQSAVQKKNIFDQVLEILGDIKDPIEQREYLKYLSHKLNIEEELLVIKLRDKLKTKQKFKKDLLQASSKNEKEYTMYTSERFKQAELELLALYICSFPDNNLNIKSELNKIDFIDDKHKLIKDYLDNISDQKATKEQILNNLMIEFADFKHIMSLVSEIAWRIHSDDTSTYTKSENKILQEAGEWINWWAKNKHQLKTLTGQLKDCKDQNEEIKILSQMVNVVKGVQSRD